ncbi:hypothetical protein [Ruminiclostridium josui]|uniref:hypothetical protein n=1 Tax=Ruminiclostridium josui TaxID=1499 RepID=UPI0004630027|nr:hypothetical protein [Ruminiclostridium josui]
MKIEAKPYIRTTEELESIVGTDCKMIFDNKGFGLEIKTEEGNFKTVGELYANKADAEQIIKQINLYDELARTIARNLVAWDTSKDKELSLLPEVYLTNRWIYKRITGEEYRFDKACKKFHIGPEWS